MYSSWKVYRDNFLWLSTPIFTILGRLWNTQHGWRTHTWNNNELFEGNRIYLFACSYILLCIWCIQVEKSTVTTSFDCRLQFLLFWVVWFRGSCSAASKKLARSESAGVEGTLRFEKRLWRTKHHNLFGVVFVDIQRHVDSVPGFQFVSTACVSDSLFVLSWWCAFDVRACTVWISGSPLVWDDHYVIARNTKFPPNLLCCAAASSSRWI